MPRIIKKITDKIKELNNKSKKARPEYTLFEWHFKIFLLGLGAVAYEILGFKLNDIELNLYYGKIQAYGPDYVFYLGAQGLILGLALWKLFEIYWWAKNTLKDREGPSLV